MYKYYPHFNMYNLAELFFRVFFQLRSATIFCDRKKLKDTRYLLAFLCTLSIFSRSRGPSEFQIKSEIFYNLSTYSDSELRIQFMVIMVENHGAI